MTTTTTTTSSDTVVADAAPQRQGPSPTALRRKAWRKSRLYPNIWRVGILVLIFALWQLGASMGAINTFLFGSPAQILSAASRAMADGSLTNDIMATLSGTLAGFAIGTTLGVVAGWGLWFTPRVQAVLDPYFVIFNALPKIALGPMLVIWLGSGLVSKIVLAAFATFVIAVLNAYQGALKVDAQSVGLVRSMGASRRQIFQMLVVPSSIPWIVAAFKINIGLALVAVIGGEFVAANAGLGYKSAVSGSLFDINGVWVAIIAILILAAALYFVVAAIEKNLMKKYT